MERKKNIFNVDDLCIRYVFDELDPSELYLLEQAVQEDQNLLIEAESLKSTWKKLKNLPEVDPPKFVTDAIISHSREHINQGMLFSNHWKSHGLMATAAVIVIGLVISTLSLIPREEATLHQTADSEFIKTLLKPRLTLPGQPIFDELFTYQNAEEEKSHFDLFDTMEGERKEPDSLFRSHENTQTNSFVPFGSSPSVRDFHLTNSPY